jgi:TonB family protein
MEFIVYLLKVNIAIILFYGIYRLLFRQDTFFQWRRLALLAIVFISFAYPAIDLTRQVFAGHELKNVVETVFIPVYDLPEVVVAQGNPATTLHFFPQMALAVYFLVSGLLFIRLLFQIGTIVYKLIHTNKKVLSGQTVYESPELKTPFSFFRWIALDSSQYSEMELQEILRHETTHVEQLHSADTLLAELVCVFCWFNPFAWLLKTEIRMNLEFLADHSVLSSGCVAEHYQLHLLRLSYHKAAAKITNNFNVSLLKKRIFMMNKKQTSNRSIWKYALMFPVIALLLLFNSSFQTKAEPENTVNEIQQAPAKAQAQGSKTVSTESKRQTPAKERNKPEIFSHVEVMPQFPGGEAGLMKFLRDNAMYPQEAQEKGIQGRVNIRFVVTPDGSVENVEVIKSLYPACDSAALRTVKMMPKWIPGKQNGNPVYVYYQFPVTFRLETDEAKKAPEYKNGPNEVVITASGSNKTATKPASVNQSTQNVIIEVDGKIISDEEFKKLDTKNIESITVNNDVNPSLISIQTKKNN